MMRCALLASHSQTVSAMQPIYLAGFKGSNIETARTHEQNVAATATHLVYVWDQEQHRPIIARLITNLPGSAQVVSNLLC